jgi:hypothetical protein
VRDHLRRGSFILSGEVEAVMDRKRYLAKAGPCSGPAPAASRVQEHQQRAGAVFRRSRRSRQENVFRFMAEWEQKAKELEGA